MQLVRTSCPNAAPLESSLDNLMIATSLRTFEAFAKTILAKMLAGIARSFAFLVLFQVSLGVPEERALVTFVFYHAALYKQPS